ncbi:MAG: PssD/Cps14F family polysaccharide biosynthesis glycosyltransferase [Gaiellales bacterium]
MRRHSQPAARQETTELLLVCSTGGHLLQLLALRPAWTDRERLWVTFDKSDARSLLAGENVVYANGPTNWTFGLRALRNQVRNLRLAVRLVRRHRPRAVLTTGAGLAVPFALVARLRGAKVIYVESLTRVHGPSLACRAIRPFAHRLYVQWPELAEVLKGARYEGNVFQP